ncbi:hypothetical protein M0804_010379 [Polistes exclamans]|nr:hypothetical protein M0804_010379 [Polistes exclamans]
MLTYHYPVPKLNQDTPGSKTSSDKFNPSLSSPTKQNTCRKASRSIGITTSTTIPAILLYTSRTIVCQRYGRVLKDSQTRRLATVPTGETPGTSVEHTEPYSSIGVTFRTKFFEKSSFRDKTKVGSQRLFCSFSFLLTGQGGWGLYSFQQSRQQEFLRSRRRHEGS